jgi:hypothetical protein
MSEADSTQTRKCGGVLKQEWNARRRRARSRLGWTWRPGGTSRIDSKDEGEAGMLLRK